MCTDEIERNLHHDYGVGHASTPDDLRRSYAACKHDLITLIDEVYRLRELNHAAGKRLHTTIQQRNGGGHINGASLHEK